MAQNGSRACRPEANSISQALLSCARQTRPTLEANIGSNSLPVLIISSCLCVRPCTAAPPSPPLFVPHLLESTQLAAHPSHHFRVYFALFISASSLKPQPPTCFVCPSPTSPAGPSLARPALFLPGYASCKIAFPSQPGKACASDAGCHTHFNLFSRACVP